jgi:hypothetical protein
MTHKVPRSPSVRRAAQVIARDRPAWLLGNVSVAICCPEAAMTA